MTLNIYQKWLNETDSPLCAREDPETRQHLIQHIISHLSLLFEPDRTRTNPSSASAHGVAQTAAGQLGAIARIGGAIFSTEEVPSHQQLCKTALSLYEQVCADVKYLAIATASTTSQKLVATHYLNMPHQPCTAGATM